MAKQHQFVKLLFQLFPLLLVTGLAWTNKTNSANSQKKRIKIFFDVKYQIIFYPYNVENRETLSPNFKQQFDLTLKSETINLNLYNMKINNIFSWKHNTNLPTESAVNRRNMFVTVASCFMKKTMIVIGDPIWSTNL